MSGTMDEQSARAELCDVYRRLEQAGLSPGNAGNVSVHLGADMLISPTGADGATVRPEDIVRTSLDGEALSAGIPSSEWAIHAEIYKAGLGRAVIHAHPDHCVALSCLRQPIPAFHYAVATFGGKQVPCAPYAAFGTRALARGVVDTLKGYSACLMANHGMVCCAETLPRALAKAAQLETLARQYCIARHSGPIVMLDETEMETVLARYRDYGTRRLSAD
ncbi:class II aldolase/adducin family protein [Chelatococcus reniformis]|uniref:class II aldolase/adducin family protein n=1 Tax=Chelatococcus reniformis TaxID=1494448 RepID=UPI001662E8CD|nr:class II aldolase/adducin family protein [Chelatococcus reniformis]